MVLFFAAISAAAAGPPPVRVERTARASVTIMRPHPASPETWDPAMRPNQREILKREPAGADVRLRLTEFE